jgi:exonuclease SbcC
MNINAEEIYILEVELFNFQSHDHTVLHFTEGINALIGTSNSGKSAALRGIKWCLDNEPSGSDFIRNGCDDSWVKTTLSHGYAIKRRKTRSGNVNTYEVFKDGVLTTEAPLTGFGTKVPPEVIEARGMPSLDYIFASQLEPSFLIHETPGKRAATIGNLEELGKVDQALQGVNDDVRVDTKEQKQLDKDIKELEKKSELLRKEIARDEPKVETLKVLKEGIGQKQRLLVFLERSAQRLQEIDRELGERRDVVARAERILFCWDDTLPAKADSSQRVLNGLNRLMAIEQELTTISFMSADALDALLRIAAEVDQKIQKSQRVNAAANRLHDIDIDIDRLRKSYSVKVASLDFSALDRQIETYRALLKHVQRLQKIEDEVIQTNKSVETARVKIDDLLNQFVESLQKAEICPTCYQSTKEVSCGHVKQFIS